MKSVDVPVALLGYGTVGSAVNRLLVSNADEIERATGHRVRVVRALVRDPAAERDFLPDPGILTTDFRAVADDPEIRLVAEVMGGLDPAGEHVLELLRSGRSVVTANKQLVARRGGELFATASAAGVQLRFEASVCGAIPVIKVLRESLSFSRVHRVLGIVNGTTNFILTRMEGGAAYAEALAEAQRLGYAEADPTDDVSGADAAAKMAILATVAFGTRVTLDDVWYTGIEEIAPLHMRAARELDMAVRLVGAATLVDGRYDVRVQPAFVDRHHPLAGVEGPFNAVMLQGDAIREIMLEGPGAGGLETASAVVSDMISVIGTTGTGFLQNDACWRELERLPHGDVVSPFYVHLEVDDRPGVLADVARRLAAHEVSVARLVQHETGEGTAALHVVLHECRSGALGAALAEIAQLPETRQRPTALPVISDRGVPGLGRAGWHGGNSRFPPWAPFPTEPRLGRFELRRGEATPPRQLATRGRIGTQSAEPDAPFAGIVIGEGGGTTPRPFGWGARADRHDTGTDRAVPRPVAGFGRDTGRLAR